MRDGPLAIDLFCGLFGWGSALAEETKLRCLLPRTWLEIGATGLVWTGSIHDWGRVVLGRAFERNPMIPQEIFDRVATHLIKQGRRSVDAAGNCLYRSPDGLQCAVGCLIPDEDYSPNMESRHIREVIRQWNLPEFFHRNINLIVALQSDHDAEENWSVNISAAALRETAMRYNLSTKVLEGH